MGEYVNKEAKEMVREAVCRERVSGEKVPAIGQFTGKLSTFPAFLREPGAYNLAFLRASGTNSLLDISGNIKSVTGG
ncbi:MAG: hypothetical protein Pars92KO_24070 [Parasphingorhabdus sp.]